MNVTIDTSRTAVEAHIAQFEKIGSHKAARLLNALADERDELLAENEIIQRSHKNVELEAADARAAAFEEAAKAVYDAGGDNTDYHIEAIRAAAGQEIVSAVVPPGWKLVPIEPTDAMKKAAFGPILHGGRNGPISADFIRQEAALMTYRKMIEAAPPAASQPEQTKERGDG